MSLEKPCSRILFFGPRGDAEGGIATVFRNYKKTDFWREFGCEHFPTTKDVDAKWVRAIYAIYRITIAAIVIFGRRRPCAASVHTSHGGSFYRKLCYLILARGRGVPAVLHVHPTAFNDFYRKGGTFGRAAVRFAAHLSDQIVFLSEDTRMAMADVVPLAKSRVVKNPVDVEEFACSRSTTGRDRARVLFLGWIVPQKGVYDLVDAMPKVLSEFPEAVFIFAGNKEVDLLRSLIERRGLSASAEVPGWVGGHARLELLRTSTILVLPSYTEGLPNVILEAMASHLPIVTTPVGAIPEVLQHEDSALFVPPGDPSVLASSICQMLRDPDMRRRVAQRAFQRVQEQFSLGAVTADLCSVYARYCWRGAGSIGATVPLENRSEYDGIEQ